MTILFLGNFAVDYSSENHHANSLQALGHTVIRMQEGKATTSHLLSVCTLQKPELFIWVHTHSWETQGNVEQMLQLIKAKGIPIISYHLDLWFGLERHKDIERDPFYKELDYFFATDKLMTDWFTENTNVQGVYLPAGVYDKEVYRAKSDGFKHDVIFVGSRGYHHEWSYRPELIDWLKQTYGDRFTHIGGDGEIPTTRGKALNQLYADTKVVVGDSLNIGFDYPYYWSDRIYETTGRGGFIIHPRIKGLDTQFEDRKEIVMYDYGNFGQLRDFIDLYLENDKPREMIRERGYHRTRKDHTYLNRWKTIIEIIGGNNGEMHDKGM